MRISDLASLPPSTAPAIPQVPFAPFAIEVHNEVEARNLAVALRNHTRYMGHEIRATSLKGIATKLNSIQGIEPIPTSNGDATGDTD